MDIKPRKLAAEELQVLCNFAEIAVRHIEKDHFLQLQQQVTQEGFAHMLPCDAT